MPEKTQNNSHHLWSHVLDSIQEKVSANSFDTWFRPIVFSGFHDNAFELTVPSEDFRKLFLTNFAAVLNDSLAQVVPNPCTLKITPQSQEIASNESAAFPVVPASKLECATGSGKSWLIENLWANNAVGFVAGPPKTFKTWTVLEMAVSVATGTPCFASFPVHRSGPVLLYAAEDPMPALRLRLSSLARNHGLEIDHVDIRVIQADSLRLDRPRDRDKLAATVDLHRPALIVLDPLVRLHSLDENQANQMAEFLGHIRLLQRTFDTAVAIVHHSRKQAAHSAGQSLRGSSDLYAFVDSLVSLHRRQGRITLSAEHRSAPALEPMPLELAAWPQPGAAPFLRIAAASSTIPKQDPLEQRILGLLAESNAGCTTDSLRTALQVRRQRLLEALRNLIAQSAIRRDSNQYFLISNLAESESV
jgi:hypothetical protein